MEKEVSRLEKTSPNLLIALQEEQAKNGCLSPEVMAEVASRYGVPQNDVFAVASFYSFLSPRLRGRHVIRICRSLPCYLKNYQMVVDAIAGEIGITPGRTTADGRFSFEFTNCIGQCDNAPAMLIDGDVHINLTPEKTAGILSDYK